MLLAIRLREFLYWMILLDLLMPNMNGHEFLNELELNERWQGIPVIALTAMELDEIERQRLEKRVSMVIQKGAYSIDQVLNAVREISGKKQAQETQNVNFTDDNSGNE